jgi:hypothetical protein
MMSLPRKLRYLTGFNAIFKFTIRITIYLLNVLLIIYKVTTKKMSTEMVARIDTESWLAHNYVYSLLFLRAYIITLTAIYGMISYEKIPNYWLWMKHSFLSRVIY